MTGAQLKRLAKQIPANAFDIIIKERRGREIFFTVPTGTKIEGPNVARAIRHTIYAAGDRYRIIAVSQ